MNDRIVSLGEVTDILSGFAFNSKHFNKSEGMPVIRIRDVVRGYSDTKYDGAFASEFVVSNGDLLIGMDGEFNIASWSGGDALLNQRVCRISTKNSAVLDERYLLHFLPKELKQIEDKTPFVTVKHLSVKSIRSIQVPLPPISVQRRIADTLDKADALRRKDQELLQKYDELAQSIFYEMFGDPEYNSKNWDIQPFGSLIRGIKAGTSLGGEDRQLLPGEFGVLKISAVTSGVFRQEEYKVPAQSEIVKEKVTVKKGDLLFSRANTRELVGAVAIAEDSYPSLMLPDKLWRIDLDPVQLCKYYCKAILTDKNIRYHLTKTATGTSGSMLNISMGKLKDLEIPVPPIDLQEEFDVLSKKLLAQKSLLEQAAAQSEALFTSLLSSYFS